MSDDPEIVEILSKDRLDGYSWDDVFTPQYERYMQWLARRI